jgi:hypothetical protein
MAGLAIPEARHHADRQPYSFTGGGTLGKQVVHGDVVIGRLERVKACLNGAARYG